MPSGACGQPAQSDAPCDFDHDGFPALEMMHKCACFLAEQRGHHAMIPRITRHQQNKKNMLADTGPATLLPTQSAETGALDKEQRSRPGRWLLAIPKACEGFTMFRPAIFCLAAVAVAVSVAPAANAANFVFDSDPFAGTAALETPGRQIIGNEISIPVFDFAADVLAFNTTTFSVADGVGLFNGLAEDIPAFGKNFIVLRNFDGDGDPFNGNQLNAGLAANLIADQIDATGAGFFIYFNSGLDLPRLVFSTDLASNTADLKVLARFTGLGGQIGRDAMVQFAQDNVAGVPEPASWAMLIAGFGLVGAAARRRHASAVTC